MMDRFERVRRGHGIREPKSPHVRRRCRAQNNTSSTSSIELPMQPMTGKGSALDVEDSMGADDEYGHEHGHGHGHGDHGPGFDGYQFEEDESQVTRAPALARHTLALACHPRALARRARALLARPRACQHIPVPPSTGCRSAPSRRFTSRSAPPSPPTPARGAPSCLSCWW